MPRVRITRSVVSERSSFQEGEERDVTPAVAQEAVAGGYGELVREQAPETPESLRRRRSPAPETTGR